MKKILNRAWAEIHLDRAEKNLLILKALLDKATKPVCVIKADAYGHGDAELMRLYQSMGIDFFAVSNLAEAVKLRAGGCTGEILILSWSPPEREVTEALHNQNIIQTAVSAEHARALSENAAKPLRIHIKLDTGMGRVGLDAFDRVPCTKEILAIAKLNNLSAEGIFTHFAAADSAEEAKRGYTSKQKELFFAAVNECERCGVSFKERHFTNSAGALLHKDDRSTLARLGITLYGLAPDTELSLPKGLEPVMDFKARISQVKLLLKGRSAGYGMTYTAEKDIITATIPVGYADGYPRLLSNKAHVLINGKKAPIIGRVCMDQMMVDVTDIESVKQGGLVTLIGKDGDEIITADQLAEMMGTIGYELVCGVSARVPRVYLS